MGALLLLDGYREPIPHRLKLNDNKSCVCKQVELPNGQETAVETDARANVLPEGTGSFDKLATFWRYLRPAPISYAADVRS